MKKATNKTQAKHAAKKPTKKANALASADPTAEPSLNQEEIMEGLKYLIEQLPAFARFVTKHLSRWTGILETIQEVAQNPAAQKWVDDELQKVDERLGMAFRDLGYLYCERLKNPSKSAELVLDGLGLWRSMSEHVPALLRFVAMQGEDWDSANDPANVFTGFVNTMCDLTEALEKFTESHPAWLRTAAGDLPYFPMRHFYHEDANNHFGRIADAIGLGKTCAIRVEGAKYSLEVPINDYLFNVLRCFQHMTWLVRDSEAAQHLGDDYIHRVNWFDRSLTDSEMALFKHVATLPPLVNTEASVLQWVDEAIMPYIYIVECGEEKDQAILLAVPAFATYLKNRKNLHKYSDARRAIRNAIRQQLKGLAHFPNSCPKSPLS